MPESGSHRAFGIGDHSPIFSCPDCEGGLFDLYSDVIGQPTVMLFAGADSLDVLSDILPPTTAFDFADAQVVTFLTGSPENAREAKEAVDWPYQTAADVNAEITDGFASLTGIEAPAAYVLDSNQRIAAMIRIDEVGSNLPRWLKKQIDNAAHPPCDDLVTGVAPALIVPRVLDPGDCRWLIDLWRRNEKVEGQVALGETAATRNDVVKTFKRREDYVIQDMETEQKVINLVMPRLAPEVSKIFHFENWNIEAFRIGCYKATDKGFFHVHRDDCNPNVKHRKYAVTINLNAGEYKGGDLRFPEYGNQHYRPDTGGAIVFSCSMLHEVVPVTAGERFVLLTFLTK